MTPNLVKRKIASKVESLRLLWSLGCPLLDDLKGQLVNAQNLCVTLSANF